MSRPALLVIEPSTVELTDLYSSKVNHATDSGFDLYMPADLSLPAKSTSLIDLEVRCELDDGSRHGYYLYPRSSIYKTSLRLANSVGIIDAGYRGTLKVAVDNMADVPYAVKKGDRLFQICMPSLEPFEVRLGRVSSETERGEGGFGSTSSSATLLE